ncbi:MAG TPA: metallophosphoesterase family protein [Gemmatimonadales bacterium]|jgi:predicted phosphodiesterase|nr:metallophosphoesterase family protein [Gemmatimonadales bacterium]
MRFAILSDIHANLPALAAVLADIDHRGVDDIVHLGDLVGYNSFPSETLALVQARGIRGVHGNHDLMACGALSVDHCGPLARRAIEWTRGALSPAELAYLAALPGELRPAAGVICLHSMLGDPVGRVRGREGFHEVSLELRRFDPQLEICCTGHTHRAGAVEIGPDGVVRHIGAALRVTPGAFWFINPGSVGQPRDSDPRAAYAVLDHESREVAFYRVAYDDARLSRDNARRGLADGKTPPRVTERLASSTLAAARAIARFFDSARRP